MHLSTGHYVIEAPCPRCGVIEPMPVTIAAVLTEPTDDDPTLKVRLKGKAIVHDCRQTRITIAADPDGDPFPDGDTDG